MHGLPVIVQGFDKDQRRYSDALSKCTDLWKEGVTLP